MSRRSKKTQDIQCQFRWCSVQFLVNVYFQPLGNTLSKKRTKIFCKMVDKMIMLNKNRQGLF